MYIVETTFTQRGDTDDGLQLRDHRWGEFIGHILAQIESFFFFFTK